MPTKALYSIYTAQGLNVIQPTHYMQYFTCNNNLVLGESTNGNGAQELTGNGVLTKGPPSLNKCNFRIVQKEWDSLEQKIWFRLEISIKYGNVFALPCIVTFHSFLQSSCLESLAAGSCGILNIDTFVRPALTFKLHQILQQEVIPVIIFFLLDPISNILNYLTHYDNKMVELL